jgi:hypothetical protein
VNTKLLASAPSIDGIETLIRKFWYSDRYSVNRDTLAIEHPEREAPKAARVVKARGRYRFEMVTP